MNGEDVSRIYGQAHHRTGCSCCDQPSGDTSRVLRIDIQPLIRLTSVVCQRLQGVVLGTSGFDILIVTKLEFPLRLVANLPHLAYHNTIRLRLGPGRERYKRRWEFLALQSCASASNVPEEDLAHGGPS